jgi:hypothetical protein
MTHTLDIGTDLDDLLATMGDLTADAPLAPALLAAVHTTATEQTAGSWTTTPTTPATSADEQPSLISPKVIRGAWYL